MLEEDVDELTELFLRARAAEMPPGARLVIVVGTAPGDGRGRRAAGRSGINSGLASACICRSSTSPSPAVACARDQLENPGRRFRYQRAAAM